MNTVTEWLCKQEKNALAVQLELIIQVHGNVGSTYSSIGNNILAILYKCHLMSFCVYWCSILIGWFVDMSHGRSHSVGMFWSQQLWIKDLGGLFGTMTECFSHNCQFHLGQGGHENFTPAPFSLPHSTIKDL